MRNLVQETGPSMAQQWEVRVEARLRQTCARAVEVYAHTATPLPTLERGSRAFDPSNLSVADSVAAPEEQQSNAWKVYVEVACARRAQACARVDIWIQNQSFYSKVQSVHSYLRERIHGEDEEVLDCIKIDAKREMLAQKVHDINVAAEPTQHEDALCRILEQTVKDLVALFISSQVQALLSSSSERAKFEFEMLQHHPGLEILVTSTSQPSASYVAFTLPLFMEKSMWDPSAVCAADDAWSVYFPDAFNHPNFTSQSEKVILSLVYSLSDHDNRDPSAWRPFSTTINWPMSLTLSSRVVRAPVSSQLLSSVETLSSCQQHVVVFVFERGLLLNGRNGRISSENCDRKQLVRCVNSEECRILCIDRASVDLLLCLDGAAVLEYDPVDFSRVFFMIQEQRDELSPLQIVILSLVFTPEYFLTLCLSNLKLSLLDGDASNSPIEVKLSPVSGVKVASESIGKLVLIFLDALHGALSAHLAS